ncbi:AAA domain protein (macronuclear) [Tetrahymena thermophila SB210]|uniref:AAA domain protein n=1 Tax=Tetrahymena thermophila (strain SB210) TaxID=312017 RepID=I7MME0_TETTS|nr:AAA domain protein [Tetrahymena thermophila SB210]EAS04672.2 AAA domain protein [Tetrahymena thermophila SB210]|eukprot:XP_001024917.2 AAA domain protein [Tetrahymena thermophila SB210]
MCNQHQKIIIIKQIKIKTIKYKNQNTQINQTKMVHLTGITEMRDDELEFQSQQSANEERDRDCKEEVTEEEEQQEVSDEGAVKKISIKKQQIEFPLLEKFKKPFKKLLPVPQNYQFDNFMQYKQTMFRLEDENYFQILRMSLQHHIKEKFKDSETPQEGFYVVSNYSVERPKYESEGLIFEVVTSVKIPRYQIQRAKILNNQIVIFVSLETQRIFIGKTIVKQNVIEFVDDEDDDDDDEDDEDEDSIKNTQTSQEDEREDDDDEAIKQDQFKIIEYQQKFKIKMNTFDNLDEFLINSNDIQTKFKLVIPSDYWDSLEKSLNCQMQFKRLNNIAFPLQTLKGEKGYSSFPQYEFLKNDGDVEYFKSYLENEISKEQQLDKYQKVALRHALFNENSIIQGPPGTGKTFLASKIVNLLQRLHNHHTLKPILVISKKNLSLDKLLLKIYSQNENINILRLGEQIKKKQIQDFTLKCQSDQPVFEYPQFSKVQAYKMNEKLHDCIENIKKRKDQNRFQQEKETELPQKFKTSIKDRLIGLLKNELKISDKDYNFDDEIQDKIFSKWMKGKLSSEKLLKYLDQADIDLDGEQKEYISKSINNQQTVQEFQLSADERSIKRYLKQVTLFEQLSVQFCKFLQINRDIIEIDIIQNEMRQFESSKKVALFNSNQDYQLQLGQFMRGYDVIGMTFSGYHKYFNAIQELGAEIVLIEEASEIIESHFYPVLTPNVKHLIQIGDHYQLRPLIKSDSLKLNYNYKMSYFERLISVNKVDHVTLYQQRRMLPWFANFTRIFYGNKYIDDPNTKSLQFVKQISKNGMYMLQHSYPDKQEVDKSFINTFEAQYVKLLVQYLLKDKKIKQKQISVLVTYKTQKILIESLLRKQKQSKKVKTYTVDEFQGDENDIVILSCVRSNMESKSGFVLNDHRINVAFSRAKIGFFCLGNFNQYALKSETWQKILDLSQHQFSLGAKGVETEYRKLSEKALKHEQYMLKDQEKILRKCGLCQEKSHIINCTAQKEIDTPFSLNYNQFEELHQIEQTQFPQIKQAQEIEVDENKLIIDQLALQFTFKSSKLTKKQKKQFSK